jgi:hypothetical protein
MRTNRLAKGASWSGGDNSAMQRYFFHSKRGRMTVLDQEGVVLADLTDVEREATRRAEEIVLREGLNAVPQGSGVVVVADDWQTVMEVPF